MTIRLTVVTPSGEAFPHVQSFQNGRLELRERPDGGLDVFGVTGTAEMALPGGATRPSTMSERLLGTYPPGSTVSEQ